MKKGYKLMTLPAIVSAIWIVAQTAWAAGERNPLSRSGSSSVEKGLGGAGASDADRALEGVGTSGIPETGIDLHGMQGEIAKLAGRIDGIETQINGIAGGLSPVSADMVGILVCAALGLGILSIIVGAVAMLCARDFGKRLENHKKSSKEYSKSLGNGEDLQELKEKCAQLEREIRSIKSQLADEDARLAAQQPSPYLASQPQQTSKASTASMQGMASQKPATRSVENECRAVADAYNNMQNMPASDITEMKRMREEFARKFSIHSFSCTNYTQRMSDPSLLPEFANEPNLTKAQYWASPLSNGTYAVVPNLKTYEDRIHRAAGMKEAFDSNYAAGQTYKHITVERPAIFSENLTMKEKGKLILRQKD